MSRRSVLLFAGAAAFSVAMLRGTTGAVAAEASNLTLPSYPDASSTERDRSFAVRAAADYPNGQIPDSALAFVAVSTTGLGDQYLVDTAAAAFSALSAAFENALGKSLTVAEAYRDLARQQYLYDGWIAKEPGFNLAAEPGTSVHGLGRAVDFSGGVNSYGTPEKTWMNANAPKYGWQPKGDGFSPQEPWHFEYDGSYNAVPAVASSVAVPGDNGTLWIWNGTASKTGLAVNTGVPIAAGTSPAIAFNGSDLAVALVTTGNVFATWVGRAGQKGQSRATTVGIMPGTSPAIVPLSDGRYAAAFQGTTGELWTWRGIAGTSGVATSTGRTMAAGTSPSITTVGSGISVAYQGTDRSLVTWYGQPTETGQVRSTGVGMKAGTSPSITRVNGSTVSVAVQANTGGLWIWTGRPGASGTGVEAGMGMKAGTSPSITLIGDELAVAAQANTGDLWTWHGAPGDRGVARKIDVGMAAGTSPSIAVTGTQLAVSLRANSGSLWTWAGGSGEAGKAAAGGIGISASPSTV
ncbi:hypothetical protein E9228_001771 [Curtobacterium flaccumfaciens]|uniref:D-alanyl-D-alanine carboxypeptidase-like core domain-containing protein n=1 Tax=Curtobacterium salicis TaxID=1779862 RepID=A0ABX0TAD8_9MICO|nr:M15 family metallopeptidase [Curtobacterium sp. WW7]NII41124.1 hypothetical protein [Curtobacterium sp. WW7]